MSMLLTLPTAYPPAQSSEEEVAAATAAGNEPCTACDGTGTHGPSRVNDCGACRGTGWGVLA